MARPKKYSPWFPPEIKPVHEGVYQIGVRHYRHWNGIWWGYYGDSALMAYAYRLKRSAVQPNTWRGLARKP